MTEATDVRLLPLAITRVDEEEACVGAVTATGEWVRPEPVHTAEVADPATAPFRYWHWTRARLAPPVVADPRPEDRALAGPPRLDERSTVPAGERPALLGKHCDASVEAVFEGARRSLALVRAEIEDLYVRRATGGRTFLRCGFRDPTGAAYDWIVPDIGFGALVWPHVTRQRIDPPVRARLLGALTRSEVYLTLGLTRPNNRFPGRFGGCHPLVVGVHSTDPALRPAAERVPA